MEELENLWQKKTYNDLLNLILAGQPNKIAVEILENRYKRFVKKINSFDEEDVISIFLNAFAHTLDPHSNYLNPTQSEEYEIQMSLSYQGIGARLNLADEQVQVVNIIPGGPAYKSKYLQKDDRIIGVAQGDDGDFVDVIGWRLDEVVQKIRGPKGSVVRLQVIKNDKDINGLPDTLRLVRDKIKLERSAAKGEIIPLIENNQTYSLGVVTVPSFYLNFDEMNKGVKDYRSTTRDVRKIVDSLKLKGIDGLMIDLRFNGGGSLQEAIELTGLFIPQGPVVQVRNTDNSVDVMKDEDHGEVFYDGPLAVLTNRYSASASEIFSGAIQDYKRGIIVGENTFGKGTVQNLIDIGRYMRQEDVELGQLKMTLAKFYRVTGSSTQRIGVAPDIEFPSPYEDEIFGESGRPTALPWDEITSAKFKPTNQIDQKMIDKLQKLYGKHLDTDQGLQELVADIEKAKELRSQTKVSLNLDERKALDAKENSVKDDLSTTIKSGEVFTDDENLEKLSEDAYLKEGLRLLAELAKTKVG